MNKPENSADLREAGVGFVYFIRAGRTPVVKIGWALDPEKRLDALQTGNAHKLQLIGFLPGSRSVESDWQHRWHHLRLRGEWLTLDTDLRMEINGRLIRPDATQLVRLPIFSNRRHAPVHSAPTTMDDVRAAMDLAGAPA